MAPPQEAIGMEHSVPRSMQRSPAGDADEYDLERQLRQAERRYAQARARSSQARAECHELEALIALQTGAAKLARQRYEMLEAKCRDLKQLIEELEERQG
jgi:chromosome segregation ATPase